MAIQNPKRTSDIIKSNIPPSSSPGNTIDLKNRSSAPRSEPSFQGEAGSLTVNKDDKQSGLTKEKTTNINENIQSETETQENMTRQEISLARDLEAERNIEKQNRFISVQNLIHQYSLNEEQKLVRQIVANYNFEINEANRQYQEFVNDLANTKKPSKILYDILLLYYIFVDGSEFIAVIIKIIAYISSGGSLALAGEPATILADLGLDIPIFGYMLLINRNTKKYISIYENTQKFIALLDAKTQNNQTRALLSSEDLAKFRPNLKQGATDIYSRNKQKIDALKNFGAGTGGSQQRKLQIASQVVSQLKSGPVKKIASQGIRIAADFIPIVEAWPFRTLSVYNLFKSYKQVYHDTIVGIQPILEDAFNNYLEQSQIILQDEIETAKMRVKLDEQNNQVELEQEFGK